ncbi:MAG: 50S ribosomal protein L4 [Thermoplasmata archaeon]|nr:MAG: 50S ribosomal protein L4 [Thermoplasmata archaeon]HDD59889.1 50S ribosomal protein L4 [Euryarchaeota archaeon]RLF71191.1 MAG: 50S ribosomal protein L4 [Thermoplasmata archaeon]RLF72254.1 MAG: 50S ribosomal protein L4 [Thermoplasmata archaeon]RLF74396.1 MAG: 50S ribosomal protein L4 [Thermoplasmata archaeon]
MAQAKRGRKKKGVSPGAGEKVNVYDLQGKVVGEIELPPVFQTPFRPDVIHRAVVAAQANRRQPYGPSKKAGMRHAVSTWGKGRGVARVQRLTQGRRAAESPNNVGGRRAHPPKPEKDWTKKVNRKERLLAIRSALAATKDPELVRARGHRVPEDRTLPVVVVDEFQSIKKTSEVMKVLRNLGLEDDVIRAKEGRHIRAGKGKRRGRKYRQPKSLLMIVPEDSDVLRSGRNLPGVHVVTPRTLNAEYLAPGGVAGRLTLITQSALKGMGGEGR